MTREDRYNFGLIGWDLIIIQVLIWITIPIRATTVVMDYNSILWHIMSTTGEKAGSSYSSDDMSDYTKILKKYHLTSSLMFEEIFINLDADFKTDNPILILTQDYLNYLCEGMRYTADYAMPFALGMIFLNKYYKLPNEVEPITISTS